MPPSWVRSSKGARAGPFMAPYVIASGRPARQAWVRAPFRPPGEPCVRSSLQSLPQDVPPQDVPPQDVPPQETFLPKRRPSKLKGLDLESRQTVAPPAESVLPRRQRLVSG